MTTMTPAKKHVWKFVRIGGFDQVRLERAEDLRSLGQLDLKLWAALSCPVRGLEFDERTLALIDRDGDGRIRVPELLAAVHWADHHLKDLGVIINPKPALPLSAISDASEEGKRLVRSAQEILRGLGRPDAGELTVEDTADQQRIFTGTRFNGDGVVVPASAGDEATKRVVEEIIATLGGVADRGGTLGADEGMIARFFATAEAYVAWQAEATNAAVRPLGEATEAAFAALAAVEAKIDDYFARTSLAAFDARAAAAMNGPTDEFATLGSKNLAVDQTTVEQLPIARVEPERPLPLEGAVNPVWAARLTAFSDNTVTPLLGRRAELTRAEWATIKQRLAPHAAWVTRKAGAEVEQLGLARVQELLASDARAKLADLVQRDLALAPEMAAIGDVERLVRYHRDLHQLLNNFVTFTDFYSPEDWAIFQAGTLFIDARSCELCVRVGDIDRHAKFADLSRTYLAYCECARKGETKFTLAAAMTGGDSDNLMPGRNGVFYDRQGRDWDATIVKIVENPISIRQAVWAPYKRVAKMIGDQIEKFAADRDKEATARASAGVSAAGAQIQGAQPKPATPFDIAKFAGIFAAIGLALGAIGSALAAIVTGFLRLDAWQMPLVIIGVFVLISGPSVLMAILKLRHRNLGPILDANGWAVNGRVKINIPFGGKLTQIARLPANARRSLEDPYEDTDARGRRRFIYFLIVLLLAGLVAAKIFGTWPFHPRVADTAAGAPAAAS